MSDWIPANVVEALSQSHQLGIFVRLDTSPALHLWFGVNDIPAGIDGVDASGTVYLGGGRLLGIPTLETLVNGTSDSVEFTLSGISPDTASKVVTSMPAVRGCRIQIGLTTLDDYYQPMTGIIPIWTGIASHVSENSPSVAGPENPTVTLQLAVVAGDNTRSRPSRSLWSAAQQKAISPTDRFCDNTSRNARGVYPVWPNY